MKINRKKYTQTLFFAISVVCAFPVVCFSETISTTPAIDTASVTNTSSPVRIFPLLHSGSFVEDSTFEVPIVLDTKGERVEGVDVRITFDKDIVAIAQLSNGVSVIGAWTEPPQYDNTKGMASYVGLIPKGIKTDSGVIGVITFKALREGRAIITIQNNSWVIISDNLGRKENIDTEKGEYQILEKLSEGIHIFSPTNPDQSNWYNNNSPTLSWDVSVDSEGVNYVLDNKPNTIPESVVKTNDSAVSFSKLTDGLWYFHLKEKKNGVWGAISHFLIKIDTVPPASFTPTMNFSSATSVLSDWLPISFFTTDNLSGVDHYEVGWIDKAQSTTASPSFVDAESPFLVPLQGDKQFVVAVRAIDKAGNVHDETIEVALQNAFNEFSQGNLGRIAIIIILMILETCILYYFFKHHIFAHLRRMFRHIKEEEISENADNIDDDLYQTIVKRESVLDKEKEIKFVEKE
jgi:hypothetical protein